MKRSAAAFLLLIFLGGIPLCAKEGDAARTIEGEWLGVLSVQGLKLRIALHVEAGDDGPRATLDSLDQGARGLPVDEIVQEGNSVRFTARRLGLSYSGTLDETGNAIRGEMKQGGATLPLSFERVTEIPTFRRKQDPVEPFPYTASEVRYRNAKDGIALAGTLTVPEDGGPHPAVILITGSGAQDRDETIAGHRPFLVLADYLTRRGIAVLRSDDRGMGGSSPGGTDDTTHSFAGDVLAAIEFLKTREEIDHGRIGLAGHSEGAVVAAMAAARSRDVAFVVMIAGMGQTGEDVIVTQTDLMLQVQGAGETVRTATASSLGAIFAALRTERDRAVAIDRMRGALDATVASIPDDVRSDFEPVRATLRQQLPMYTTAWFRTFIDYDPAADLKKVGVPLLAVTGALDLQAPPKENLPLIEKGARAGGNHAVTVRELPRLNHLLQTAETGHPMEYGAIEETIAPAALEAIAEWITDQTSKGAGTEDP